MFPLLGEKVQVAGKLSLWLSKIAWLERVHTCLGKVCGAEETYGERRSELDFSCQLKRRVRQLG